MFRLLSLTMAFGENLRTYIFYIEDVCGMDVNMVNVLNGDLRIEL